MGGGVFVVLGLAAGVAGNGVLLALLLNGIVTIPTLMVYAELSSTSADAGGGYLWIRQALGRFLGFLGGWSGWFSHVVASALYCLAAGVFLLTLAQFAGWVTADPPALEFGTYTLAGQTVDLELGLLHAVALAVAMVFVVLNYAGVKVGIRVENVVTVLVLAVLVAFIGAGMWRMGQDPAAAIANFTPFWRTGGFTQDMSGVFLAMGISFIAFVGYEIIAQTSEEIQSPRRNVPRAMWTSFLVVWGIVLLIALVAIGVTRPEGGLAPWQHLAGLQERALISVAGQVIPYGTILIAGAALFLQITAINATIYSSSRVSFAMGRDGNLPHRFARVHPKRRTPSVAVLGSGALILVLTLLPLGTVLAAADVMFLLLFLVVNLAYIKLHKVIPQERFGFKAPLFPYLPLAGIFAKSFLAIYLWRYQPWAWYIAGGWLALGLLYYATVVRHRATHEAPVPRPLPLPRPAIRGPRKDFRILAVLTSPAPSSARGLARSAGAIAKALDGEVILLQPVLVPEVTPLSEGSRFTRDQSLLNEARRAVPSAVPVHASVRIGHNLDAMVRESVREESVSLLLLSGQARATVGQPTSPLLAYPPCDLAVLRLKNPEVVAHKVLLTVQDSTQAPLGVRLATALAKAYGGHVTLHHVRTAKEARGQAWGRTVLDHNAVAGVKADVATDDGEPVPAVLERSRGHDLVVVAASVAPRAWRKTILAPATQEIADRVAGNVLIVCSGQGLGGPQGNWLGRRLLQLRRYFLPE